MDEEKNENKTEEKEDLKNQAEDLKKETKETVKKVKETIKEVDFKNDTKETTGFLKTMFSDPFATVKKVAKEEENVLKKDIVIVALFLVLAVCYGVIWLIFSSKYYTFGSSTLRMIGTIVSPLIAIIVPTIIVYVMNRKNKKPLTTVLSTVVISKVPQIFQYVLSIINVISTYKVTLITTPLSSTLDVLSIILLYFGLKDVFNVEEDHKFFGKFMVIIFLTELVISILTRCNLYYM